MLSFFFTAESYATVYVYHLFLSAHPGTVCFLPRLRCGKAAALPAWVQGFLQVWFLTQMLLRVGQPDHRAALFVYSNAF